MRLLYPTYWLLFWLMATPSAGNAQSRVALVIGNSNYQNVTALPNPVNDASDISLSLKRLGFDVKTLTNAKFDDMRRALIEFGQKARGAEFAVVFFAGHGMEIGGENWLIPVDAQLTTDLDVANETIGLQSVTRAVSNTTKLGLVVLDACRSNPFLPKMQRTNLTRAVDRGLARIEPNDNILVAYSARDGTTANDGSGRNSPFTSSLLKNIETPGLDVRFLFAGVRDDVMAATKREQQPFIYGSLSKDFVYLKSPLDAGASTPTGDGSKPDAALSAIRPTTRIPQDGSPTEDEIFSILIPEGLTSEQVVVLISKNELFSGAISEVPREGTLLPETYKFPRGTTREQVIARMQQAQKRALAEIWERRNPDLPIKSPEQLVTLASIVEKETGKPDERSRVAAVFVNRLRQKIKLQSDPTIIYGLVGGKGTLGRPIKRSEIQQPSPYNTYVVDGLPPGPIANPGRASLEAAANPARTRDLFFVADGTGGHAFSDTYDQYQKNVAKLRAMEKQIQNDTVEPADDPPPRTLTPRQDTRR
jgi:YceG-like family/Caspase domain